MRINRYFDVIFVSCLYVCTCLEHQLHTTYLVATHATIVLTHINTYFQVSTHVCWYVCMHVRWYACMQEQTMLAGTKLISAQVSIRKQA